MCPTCLSMKVLYSKDVPISFKVPEMHWCLPKTTRAHSATKCTYAPCGAFCHVVHVVRFQYLLFLVCEVEVFVHVARVLPGCVMVLGHSRASLE